MSHTIIYKRLFIKAIDKDGVTQYLPMTLHGANNCTQISSRSGREVRERDWHNNSWFNGNKILTTENNILQNIDEYRLKLMKDGQQYSEQHKDESYIYNDNRFGWHSGIVFSGKGTTGTSFKSFRNFYELGMKQALTLEQLAFYGISIVLNVSEFSEDKIKAAGLIVKPNVEIQTSEQLIQIINEYEEYYKNIDCLYVTYDNEYSVAHFLNHKRLENKRERKQKTRADLDFYYVIGNKNGFFVKYTRRGYKYSVDSNAFRVKKFRTEKEANKKLAKLHKSEGWEIVKVNEKISILV